MAASKYPTQQYLAGDFVISAGSVLFRNNIDSKALEICILHELKRDEWLLPKGRKDRGETIAQAAIRETYEETGYPCELWPQRMPTRAPEPGLSNVETTQVVDDLVEPVGMTIRNLEPGIKVIFWYIGKVKEGARKEEGTQMETENFESIFVDAREAVERLTFEGDRDIVRKVLEIVEGRMAEVYKGDASLR